MMLFNKILLLLLLSVLFSCSSAVRQVNLKTVDITSKFQRKYSVAINYLKNNQVKKAQKLLTNLAKEFQDFPGIHLNLALIYYRLSELELSRKSINIVLKISPENSLAYNLSGTLYRKAGEFTLARKDYLTALKISPNYADAHLNIAILFDIYLQSLLDAKQHYLKYLKYTSDDNKQVELWLQDLETRISKG
ncbi:hypothetical protein MNBD_GAMMA22-1965 [hydrothermal vent metagenome]|uniref:Uncharacterized protein n=1 Tax=hydrothermal vent metagenome TaxID=652676 RepID=A0A3B1ANC4_9ZZZZ